MMLLLVVLLEIYLRELRTESIYLPIKYLSLQKRGFFMMLLLVILLEMYLREIKNGGHLFAIKLPPLFRKEGARGRFYDFNLSKTNFPIISICAFSAFNAGM